MAPVALAGRVDGRTVLLADDDEDFRVALAEALDEDGVAVSNGAPALAAIEHVAKGAAARSVGARSADARQGRHRGPILP